MFFNGSYWVIFSDNWKFLSLKNVIESLYTDTDDDNDDGDAKHDTENVT